jgi:hypothetical protein
MKGVREVIVKVFENYTDASNNFNFKLAKIDVEADYFPQSYVVELNGELKNVTLRSFNRGQNNGIEKVYIIQPTH